MDDRGIVVRFTASARHLSLLKIVPTGSGAHSASYLMCTGGGGVIPGVNRPEHEADH
jgi:hypothetical protein